MRSFRDLLEGRRGVSKELASKGKTKKGFLQAFTGLIQSYLSVDIRKGTSTVNREAKVAPIHHAEGHRVEWFRKPKGNLKPPAHKNTEMNRIFRVMALVNPP